MAFTGRKLVGKAAAFKLGAGNGAPFIPVVSWNVDFTNQVQEVTSSESGGWQEWETGIDGGSGSLVAVWDCLINPFDEEYFRAGKKTTLQALLERGNTAGTFVMPMIFTNIPLAVAIAGRVELTINFNINGEPTFPTGSIDTAPTNLRRQYDPSLTPEEIVKLAESVERFGGKRAKNFDQFQPQFSTRT